MYNQGRIQDFPLGGAPTLVGGGANLQHRHFSVKTYVKTKEFGPVGGGARRKLLYVDPPLIMYIICIFRYLSVGCTHGTMDVRRRVRSGDETSDPQNHRYQNSHKVGDPAWFNTTHGLTHGLFSQQASTVNSGYKYS